MANNRREAMRDGDISTQGIDKAELLAALYNAAKPLGMGYLHYTPEPMPREEAAELLKQSDYFDYVKGRVMKVRIRGDELSPHMYDRDNGNGAAQAVVDSLRAKAVAA
jgi:hypothetical protein